MTAASFDTLSHPLRVIQCVSYSTNLIQCLIHLSKSHSMHLSYQWLNVWYTCQCIINCALNVFCIHWVWYDIYQCLRCSIIHWTSLRQCFIYTMYLLMSRSPIKWYTYQCLIQCGAHSLNFGVCLICNLIFGVYQNLIQCCPESSVGILFHYSSINSLHLCTYFVSVTMLIHQVQN